MVEKELGIQAVNRPARQSPGLGVDIAGRTTAQSFLH